MPPTAALMQRLMRATDAPTLLLALRFLGEYLLVRAWSFLMQCFPIEANLATARWMGRIWWRISPRHRNRAMTHLRAAFESEYSEPQLERIARGCFEHFAQVYLVELTMTSRLVTKWSWSRYVELGDLGPALRELLEDRGALMLTPHFGNFELLGFVLCSLGIPIVAIMRPLDNRLINEFLVRQRAAGGMRLLFKKGATAEADDVVRAGKPLCFIADQDAGKKGIFAKFFGRQASTYKSIPLLAIHHQIPIIVGCAPRIRTGFHYRIEVERIIQPSEWRDRHDAMQWITQEFSSAMERCIRRHPEQYLWIHRRWKTQPKTTSQGN